MKSFKFLILYLSIITCIGFFVLECCVRILHLAPALPPRYAEFINDRNLPFRLKPNIFRRIKPWPEGYEFEFDCTTNSQGFRDVEHSFDKPKGIFRILALGDSFTFGGGAPQEGTYPYQLEKLLNEPINKLIPVEIINAGQPKYWPEPERLLLENIGIKYKPDLIITQFTPNDLYDTHFGLSYPEVRSGYLISREGYELGNIGVWLYVNSHLSRMVIRLYLDRKLRHLVYDQSGKMKWDKTFKANGYYGEKDWLLIESEYNRMIQIANKIGARILFIYIPRRPYDNDYALKRLIKWGRDNGVSVVDTLTAINRASIKEKTYWTKDIHCTEAGYRVIAETVCDYLIMKRFIPRREGD